MDTKELKEKEKIVEEVIKEEIKRSVFAKPWFQTVLGTVVILAILAGFIFWRATNNQIKIENSIIKAPIISLSPTSPNTLEEIYVKVGDKVSPNTPVAKVGNEIVVTKVGGIIASVNHQEGQFFSPGQAVVTMVNLDEEKVVGKIDEDKGLKNIKIGQKASFTVDAFGAKKFAGIVDEISPMSDVNSVIFNISDKRAVQQFDVNVRFDLTKYPELKEGMSARITVFTK